MFNFFRKKTLFTDKEIKRIESTIHLAEQTTSGEIRIFFESHCNQKNILQRAEQVFTENNMFKTKERNAILIYVAFKDKVMAIYGDVGIHQKLGETFWKEQVNKMLTHFKNNQFIDGILQVIIECGNALTSHFPYNSNTDINELSDEIIFGK